MASSLKYLNGVRTRCSNDLKEQINEASVIFDEEVYSGKYEEILQSIDYSVEVLKECLKNFKCQSEKLISAIEDGEDPLIDEILNGDESALSSANGMITKLRKFEIVVKDKMKKEESLLMQTKKDDSQTDIQKLIEMQL